jgi:hypothetical protein
MRRNMLRWLWRRIRRRWHDYMAELKCDERLGVGAVWVEKVVYGKSCLG